MVINGFVTDPLFTGNVILSLCTTEMTPHSRLDISEGIIYRYFNVDRYDFLNSISILKVGISISFPSPTKKNFQNSSVIYQFPVV